jgi:D-alanyl-D-alanine carboxypeptidase
MRINVYYIATIICLLAFCFCVPKRPIKEEMQTILDKTIIKYGVNGVSAAVIFPDKSIWTGVSGISHDTVAIKPDMLFAIGSITKNFVAILTLKLVEEGALSLDDSLSKWLPAFPNINGAITIRQLLNHTSGIYMFWSNQRIWDDLKKDRTKIWTPEEVLSYIKEPYFPPGEGYRYSNTNYLLMAMIIEKVTASNLSTEFRERFWKPLAIKNAYLSIQEEIPENQAHVFGDNFNNDGSNLDLTFLPRASHESITFGSAGLFMTAKDLAHWCYALFEGEVLNRQSMKEMLNFDSSKSGYGLGVGLFKKSMGSGEKVIGHSGANIGTSAYMVHLPDHHFSVVVMINGFDHECSAAITKKIIANILRDLDVIGIILYLYYKFYPLGLIIICAIAIWIIVIGLHIRKKRKLLHA